MLVVVLLLVSIANAAIKPYVDVPYEEIVSKRFTLASAAPIYNWGQLPFDDVTQVLLGSISSTLSGTFVLSSSSIVFISTSDFSMYAVDLAGITLTSGSRIAVRPDTQALAIVATPGGLYQVSCSLSGSTYSCDVDDSAVESFGVVNDAIVASASGTSLVAYVAAMTGGFRFVTGSTPMLMQSEPPTSVAFFAPKSLVAFGSNSSLTTYINTTLIRRDWATNLETASGGVYDAPITSLAFDSYGWLFIGTQACVDILFPNSTVNHLSRFQGLPYNVTTSVSIEYGTRLKPYLLYFSIS